MSIEEWINSNAVFFVDLYDKDHLIIKPDNLREFVRGKVLVDAKKLELLHEVLRMYEDFTAEEDDAFNYIEQALRPTSEDKP